MNKWEFDCPQYVDFSAGLESGHPTDDVFFNDASKNEKSDLKKNYYEAFAPKMATPKIKPMKSLRNSPFVNVSRPIVTDDDKIAAIGKLHSRLSKSDGGFSKDVKDLRIQEKENIKSHCKRSLSDSCIKRKRVHPVTPECLKRYLTSKLKKPKTTEELELERIAELQNMLQQHLRLNRMNLERMKANKAPFPFKSLSRKNKCKAAPLKDKELEDLRIPSKPLPESDGRKLKWHNKKANNNMPPSNELVNNAEQMKIPVPTKVLKDLNGLDNICKKDLKTSVLFENYKGHGGLKFVAKQAETFPENFSFDTSVNASFNTSLRKIHK